MQVRQLILTGSAFVIAGAGLAYAQDSAPVAGDSGLPSLVAEALARNPTVAQRQATVRAATLRIRPAGSLPDPMLTVGVMDLVLPHFEFNQSDFTEADVELSQEIPWPGSLGARSGVMRAAAAAARAEEGTVRREVTTAMAVAYYRLGYAVTALETLRHQRELLDAAVQLSTTRYATGAAPQSDPLQAKLARDRLRSEEFALESERIAALATVNALRSRAPGDSVPVTSIDLAALRAGAAPQPPADSRFAVLRSTRPRARFRSSDWERVPTLRSRHVMGTGPSRSGSTIRTSSPPSWACASRSGRGANRTGSPTPPARIRLEPRLGCATRSSSPVARSLKPLPESSRHSSVWRSSWTASCPMRGEPSNRCCGATRSVAPNS